MFYSALTFNVTFLENVQEKPNIRTLLQLWVVTRWYWISIYCWIRLTEAYLGPCQISKIEPLWKELTSTPKSSIIDLWQGLKHTSELKRCSFVCQWRNYVKFSSFCVPTEIHFVCHWRLYTSCELRSYVTNMRISEEPWHLKCMYIGM